MKDKFYITSQKPKFRGANFLYTNLNDAKYFVNVMNTLGKCDQKGKQDFEDYSIWKIEGDFKITEVKLKHGKSF